jgi:hypothetical protein
MGEPELKNKIEVDEVELVLPVSATANGIKDSQKSSQIIIELIQENPNATTLGNNKIKCRKSVV